MDRKEEIQKAAEEARTASAETLTTHGVHSHIDDIPFIDLSYDEIAEQAFVKGAEWADSHPKNAWIDTRDCKGSSSSTDCILILEGGDVTRGYYNDDEGWLEYPDYENVLDDVRYWMDCDYFKDQLMNSINK